MKWTMMASGALLPLSLIACSSSPIDSVGASSEAIVSTTTTYLLPAEDDVREACRSTWTRQWCDGVRADSAGQACVAAMLSSGVRPACASQPAGCFQLLVAETPCTGDGPIYPSAASCQAPVERTCAFYSACLEADKACGDAGYALGYGEKYCSRFDVDGTFSPRGVAWRDAVLHCLQLALVPELPSAPTTSCDALTTFAFDSHPRCYTESPSICFLPLSDITNVLGTIDGKDLLSLRSAKQMATVAADCVDQLGSALLGFDHPDARVPEEMRDRAVLSDRLLYWQAVQETGIDGVSRD